MIINPAFKPGQSTITSFRANKRFVDYVLSFDKYTHETASDDDFQLLYFDRRIAYV